MGVRAGRDGILSALMPGMATGYAQQGQIASFYSAVEGNRLLGIGGTTGIKPTIIAHEWTEAGFVAGDKKNEQATH